jgi:hypothetical protein
LRRDALRLVLRKRHTRHKQCGGEPKCAFHPRVPIRKARFY